MIPESQAPDPRVPAPAPAPAPTAPAAAPGPHTTPQTPAHTAPAPTEGDTPGHAAAVVGNPPDAAPPAHAGAAPGTTPDGPAGETPRTTTDPGAPTAPAGGPAGTDGGGNPTATDSDAPADPAPASPTAVGGTGPGRVWQRARGVLAGVGILLVGAVALAALGSGSRHGHLDPRSADPAGSRAVAELLKAHGVTTRVVTTAEEAADAAGPGTTLLVAAPDRLREDQRRAIRSAIDLSGGRTLLLAPGPRSLPDLAPATRVKGRAGEEALDPACTLPAAVSAGRAATGGDQRYAPTTTGAACYPSAGSPTLLVLPSTTRGGDTVVLGSEQILLNRTLADEGNASLALQLLGTRPDLVWYLPSLEDTAETDPDRQQGLLELVPAGWSWALLQLFVAAALAALWRARRLGPLVTEKLPVAIRASEATEGRARLYRKAAARDRAATVLRAAARERLAALVGVAPGRAHDPAALAPAVSARLTGAAAPAGGPDPAALLFGPAPADDAALVALADHLDALEREVRSS